MVKKMTKKQLLVCFTLGIMFMGVILMAKDITEVQPIDASQRNQITVSSGGGVGGLTAQTVTNLTSSGGTVTITGQGSNVLNLESSGGSTVTNIANNWAGINTFNALTITTNISLRNGYLMINTNDNAGLSRTVTIEPVGGRTENWVAINTSVGGSPVTTAGLLLGDFNGAGANVELDISANNARMIAGGSANLWSTSVGGITMFQHSSTLLTLGASSSSAITMNGATHTIANTPQVNTDVWKWASAGGTLTNGTSLFVQNTLSASNIVTRSTDGFAYDTTVAGVTNKIESVNAGAGIKETRALYMFSTNTLSAALPEINTIYTNNLSRMNLAVTATFDAGSSAYIWTVSGSQTNEFGLYGTSVASTNTIVGYVQPSALYMVSNGLGTVTLHPGRWNGVRE